MSDESSDIDILYVELTSLRPGTPAFLRQQVHLLENLQKSHKYIPTDYKAFLDCVKSLKTSYQPAVILGAWKVLLDKHLLRNLGERKNCTTSENVEQNITDKLLLTADFEKNVPNQTIDSINSNTKSVPLKTKQKNSNPKKKIATVNKIEQHFENKYYTNYYTHDSKFKKKPRKNSGSVEDNNKGKKLKLSNKKSKDGQNIQICISRDEETSNNSINALSKPELIHFFMDGNSCLKKKKNVECKMSNNQTATNSIDLFSKSKPELSCFLIDGNSSLKEKKSEHKKSNNDTANNSINIFGNYKPELSCFLMDGNNSFKDNNNGQSKILRHEMCNNIIITVDNSKPEGTDFSKDKESCLHGNSQLQCSHFLKEENKCDISNKKTAINKMTNNSTNVGNTQFKHNYAFKIEKKSFKNNKKSILNISQNKIPNSTQSKINMFLINEGENSVISKYETENFNFSDKEIKINSEHQSDINANNVAKANETGFDNIQVFRNNDNTKYKRKKGELNFGQKSTGLNRKKKESFENAKVNEYSSSLGEKKKYKSNFSLEDLTSTVLGDSIGKKKSKNKITNIDESDLDKYGLSKSELIQFFKEQKEEKVAEEKKIERQMLEIFHERLVDVIIPKYFSFN